MRDERDPDEYARRGGDSAANVIDCAHFIEDAREDKLGFLTATCACGWTCPPSPDEETRTDFLMQHAYEAGILTERNRAT